MSVTPGMRIGPYEVRERIGAGGMGEVWLAHDARLRRDAALKFLPDGFARDHERLARFRREAQTLAQLNHPNIAQIFGLHGGTPEEPGTPVCLAMEYVAGETLAEMIEQSRDRKGAGVGFAALGGKDQKQPPLADARGTVTRETHGLPMDDALNITVQICEALEHAHEKGIIHRDLKPANVKVTPEGKVKVLDFGLAKAFSAEGSSGGAAAEAMNNAVMNDGTTDLSPAYVAQPLTASPTIPGVILGTAAYMSPEQARGKPVDKRTDIWALGCVLYEMLTGEGAFYRCRDRQGAGAGFAGAGGRDKNQPPLPDGRGTVTPHEPDTAQDILARILSTEPDWLLLPAATPAYLRGILRRCLQKERAKRLASANDISLLIQDAGMTGSGSEPQPVRAAAPLPRWKQYLPWGLATAGLIAAVVVTMLPRFQGDSSVAAPLAVTRVDITLPEGLDFRNGELALSPDGKYLAFVARGLTAGRGGDLYVRNMETGEGRLIPGSERAMSPFFSPDSRWVAYFSLGVMNKVSVSGGSPVVVAAANETSSGVWGPDDTITFSAGLAGLVQVPASGGTARPVTFLRIARGERGQDLPYFLPDGTTILYTSVRGRGANPDSSQIVALRLDTGEEKTLITGGSDARYVATGHLVYYRPSTGTVLAVRFYPSQLKVLGEPVPVMEGVLGDFLGGNFDVSNRGTLVYASGSGSGRVTSMVWVDRAGNAQSLPAPAENYGAPRLSPDGRRVAVSANGDVWVYDLARDTKTRLTFEGTLGFPSWSPDSKRIIFNKTGAPNLFWKPADGSGVEEPLTPRGELLHQVGSFSSDGRYYFYSQVDPKTNRDLWVLPMEGDRKPRVILQTNFNESTARISPDGKWLAYLSDETGRYEVFVRPFPGPGGKWQISNEGGAEVLWSPIGNELFYRSGSRIMAVDIQVGQAFLPAGSENLKKPQAGMPAPPGFEAGKPKMLFDGPYLPTSASFPFYDVSPDGQRFLMLKPVETEATAPTQINVVLNWFEELRQKAPAK